MPQQRRSALHQPTRPEVTGSWVLRIVRACITSREVITAAQQPFDACAFGQPTISKGQGSIIVGRRLASRFLWWKFLARSCPPARKHPVIFCDLFVLLSFACLSWAHLPLVLVWLGSLGGSWLGPVFGSCQEGRESLNSIDCSGCAWKPEETTYDYLGTVIWAAMYAPRTSRIAWIRASREERKRGEKGLGPR